jgi:NDP-sugar pyrophosphorylase family protein
LGTAHGLRHVKGIVEGKFMVLSGDNIIEPDTIASFMMAKPNTILVKEQEDVSKYGVVIVGDGAVEDIIEKPREAPGNLANTGIYVLTPEVFEFARDEVDLPSVLRQMIIQGYRFTVEEARGAWLDVVYPWDILKLNDITLRKISPGIGGTIEDGVIIKGLVSIGRDTVVRANSYIVGPVIIGENCEIGPGVCLFPATSLGDNVIISPFTQIRNSVIDNNVYIGPSSSIQDSIIDRGSVLGAHFIARSGEAVVEIDGEYQKVSCGVMLGEGCNIEDSVIAQPGTMIGNYSQLRALKIASGSIPDRSLVV